MAPPTPRDHPPSPPRAPGPGVGGRGGPPPRAARAPTSVQERRDDPHDPGRPRRPDGEYCGAGAEDERDHRRRAVVEAERERARDQLRRERIVEHPVDLRRDGAPGA
jgi:hypothetical protein